MRTGDAWNRSLAVLVDDPARCQQLHAAFYEAIGIQQDAAYEPHLSLLYKKGLSAEEREALAQEINERDALTRTVSLDRLGLWRTSGPPEEWACVKWFRLGE